MLNHHKFFQGTGNQTFTYDVPVRGINIVNNGTASLSFTINDETAELDAGESYEGVFTTPFKELTITATSTYKGEVLR